MYPFDSSGLSRNLCFTCHAFNARIHKALSTCPQIVSCLATGLRPLYFSTPKRGPIAGRFRCCKYTELFTTAQQKSTFLYKILHLG